MNDGEFVLVTTEHRGVFAGLQMKNGHDEEARTVRLANARNCVYWSKEVRGVFGLAASGPTQTCRIGPMVDSLYLVGVTSVTRCTAEAQRAWESEPWS